MYVNVYYVCMHGCVYMCSLKGQENLSAQSLPILNTMCALCVFKVWGSSLSLVIEDWTRNNVRRRSKPYMDSWCACAWTGRPACVWHVIDSVLRLYLKDTETCACPINKILCYWSFCESSNTKWRYNNMHTIYSIICIHVHTHTYSYTVTLARICTSTHTHWHTHTHTHTHT